MRIPGFVPALATFAASLAAQTRAEPVVLLRPVLLADGILDLAPKQDPARFPDTELGKLAAQAGLDLRRPDNPVLAAKFADRRLFYVFFKTTENTFGPRPWLVQRIRKVERTWGPGANEPVEKVTYQVEAFKLMNGALKKADQHHGSFPLRDAVRREIVKDYEIGFGTLPGVAEGDVWPFANERLFELLQPYQEDKARFDEVVFSASRTWSLAVSLAADGAWSVRSPELGIDAPKAWPTPSSAEPRSDDSSRDVVLRRGAGTEGLLPGTSTAEDVGKVLGAPIDDAPTGTGARVLAFARSLSVNVDAAGVLNTLMTRPGFAGRTDEGLRHGMTREQVRAAAPPPAGTSPDARTWRYDGLLVDFDGTGRVRRFVVTKKG